MSEAGAGRRVRTDVAMDEGTDFVITNWNSDVALDCDSTSDGELADVLGTLIERLIALGVIGGSVAA